jgi:hypothetical protein
LADWVGPGGEAADWASDDEPAVDSPPHPVKAVSTKIDRSDAFRIKRVIAPIDDQQLGCFASLSNRWQMIFAEQA